MLSETFELFKLHYSLWFIIFFDEIMMTIIISSLMINISEGEHNLLPLYLLLTVFFPLFSVIVVQESISKIFYVLNNHKI